MGSLILNKSSMFKNVLSTVLKRLTKPSSRQTL